MASSGVNGANSIHPRKRKTCVRCDIPGHAHALTFTCFRGQPFSNRDRTRLWLMKAIDESRRRLGFDVWAYVIMPEHVHLLILPRDDDSSVADVLQSIKRPVARKAVAFVRAHASMQAWRRCARQGSLRLAMPPRRVYFIRYLLEIGRVVEKCAIFDISDKARAQHFV
jgi:REP element-mobilizing transposase RayT